MIKIIYKYLQINVKQKLKVCRRNGMEKQKTRVTSSQHQRNVAHYYRASPVPVQGQLVSRKRRDIGTPNAKKTRSPNWGLDF